MLEEKFHLMFEVDDYPIVPVYLIDITFNSSDDPELFFVKFRPTDTNYFIEIDRVVRLEFYGASYNKEALGTPIYSSKTEVIDSRGQIIQGFPLAGVFRDYDRARAARDLFMEDDAIHKKAN